MSAARRLVSIGPLVAGVLLALSGGCLEPGQPGLTPPPASTAVPPQGAGYLEGRAAIGPLTPVERVGVPTPTPAPEVCTSRGLSIFGADGKTEVNSFSLQPDCSYRVALRPGTYVVRLRQAQTIGGSKDLPKTITVEEGKAVRLDISIDTGIR